jgi:hypothetical protein
LKAPPKPTIENLTKLYTLVVKYVFCFGLSWSTSYSCLSPDNTYKILIDGESQQTGSLLEDFDPAVNPPTEIDDPNDVKPEDWVDKQRIPDPDATKVCVLSARFVFDANLNDTAC